MFKVIAQVIVGFIFSSIRSYASSSAILFTSIDIEQISKKFSVEQREEFESEFLGYPSYLHMLSGLFEEKMSLKGFKTKVVHHADQDDLFQVLKSHSYSVIFWVSHASRPDLVYKSPVLILDQYGFDVGPVFSEINLDQEVLTLISCHSSLALSQIFRNTEKNTSKKLMGFPFPVDVKKGLLYALDQITEWDQESELKNNKSSTSISRDTIQVQVSRTCAKRNHAFYPALRLTSVAGKVLGTFPQCKWGEKQIKTFTLDEKSRLLIVSTGIPSEKNKAFSLGVLNAESKLGRWRLLRSKSTGKPLGWYSQTFRLEKSVDPLKPLLDRSF